MALLCLLISACSATPPTGKVLFEDPRGTVFLRAIPDRSFQASHPINLEPALISRVLTGVLVQERQRALQAVLAEPSSIIPVFSTEEIQFLAPRLAGALSTAATNQAVGFLVTSPRSGDSLLEHSTTETTAGSLYVYGQSLYFSLSKYRYAPSRTTTEHIAHRRLPDSSGLSDRALLFTPTFAQRSDTSHRPAAGASTDQFLVIDYHLLKQVPPTPAASEQPAARPEGMAESARPDVPVPPSSQSPSNVQSTLDQHDDEIHKLKDLVIKKDLELESLRQELQSIRRQLDDRTTRQESQKKKNKPPSKVQSTGP